MEIARQCSVCSEFFRSGAALASHAKIIHGQKSELVCSICGVKFAHTKALNCHMNAHKMEGKGNFSCHLCKMCFHRNKLLLDHFKDTHQVLIITENLTFKSLPDFLRWKEKIELETCSLYVNDKGVHKGKAATTMRYLCHRGGITRKKVTSKKINIWCPARMIVKENEEGVSVAFTKTHQGHDFEPAKNKSEKKPTAFEESKKELCDIAMNLVSLAESVETIEEIEALKGKFLAAQQELQRLRTRELTSENTYVIIVEQPWDSFNANTNNGSVLVPYPIEESPEIGLQNTII